jgi:hypothetical protein
MDTTSEEAPGTWVPKRTVRDTLEDMICAWVEGGL